jgi:hypothetical protein
MRYKSSQENEMCYLCLADTFQLEAPKNKLVKSKDRAAEIKRLLKLTEKDPVCDEGDKVIDLLKEEQYKLSQEM